MGSVTIELNQFCAGCSKPRNIEDSAGHHVLSEPCYHCTQAKVEQTAKKIKVDDGQSKEKEARDAKTKQWNEEKEKMLEEEKLTTVGEPIEGDDGYDS